VTERTEVVSRIMDKASRSTPNALFAGLQAAVGVAIEQAHPMGEPKDFYELLQRVEDAIDIGGPVGSPEWRKAKGML
jgi:hypothetical protein